MGEASTSYTRPEAEGRPVQISLDPRLLRQWRRWAGIGVGIGLLLWFAYMVREIWIPLAIAFLIAMVLDPVVDRMEQRGWSRAWATLLIFVGFFSVMGGVLYLAVPAVVGQAQEISTQVSRYIPASGDQAQASRSLHKMLDRAKAPPLLRMAAERGVGQLSLAFSRSTAWVSEHALGVLSNLIWLVIIPIVTYYALKDFHLIFAKSLLLVPRERRDLVQTMVAEVTTIFARFLRGLMLVSFLNGAATWGLLVLLRTPNAFTLGAIAGLLYSVPYFGALMTIVLVAGVAFLHGGLQYMVFVVIANVLLHQLLFDQIITPRLLGGHVGLHPILSIVALLIGNVLLGIVGMLLAEPVAASIQLVVLALVPRLRHEINLPANPHEPPDTVESLSATTQQEQLSVDATEALHRSVSQAVEAIEAQTDGRARAGARVETEPSIGAAGKD